MRFSEEWKLESRFNGGWYSVHFRWKCVKKPCLQLRKEEWHRCGTYKMDSDVKVSNDVINVERKWHKLQGIKELMLRI